MYGIWEGCLQGAKIIHSHQLLEPGFGEPGTCGLLLHKIWGSNQGLDIVHYQKSQWHGQFFSSGDNPSSTAIPTCQMTYPKRVMDLEGKITSIIKYHSR